MSKNIELSNKDVKTTIHLATKLNELIERGKLQKVWEDEGVIVGRSLDMFISKLRKNWKLIPKFES